MATKRDQLFKQRFDEFMGEPDDGFDDDLSVGSGSAAGLTGLRPAGTGLGSLSSPVKRGLGSLPCPANKPPARPFGGLGGKPLGGLGGRSLGGLGGKSFGGPSKPAPSAAPAPAQDFTRALDDVVKSTSNLSLEVTSSLSKIATDNAETLKAISAFVKGLSEQTVDGFKEVSNRLNQQHGDGLQESLDAMVKNIDDEIAAKPDVAYVIVPGHETATITTDEIAELVKDKSIRVVGSVSQLTF